MLASPDGLWPAAVALPGQPPADDSKSPYSLISLIEQAVLQQSRLAVAHHLLFRIFGNKKTAWIQLRPAGLCQSHVVTPHNAIGHFPSAMDLMDLLHTKHRVGPGSVFHVLDGANPKIADNLLVLDLADRVVIPQLIHRVHPQV